MLSISSSHFKPILGLDLAECQKLVTEFDQVVRELTSAGERIATVKRTQVFPAIFFSIFEDLLKLLLFSNLLSTRSDHDCGL